MRGSTLPEPARRVSAIPTVVAVADALGSGAFAELLTYLHVQGMFRVHTQGPTPAERGEMSIGKRF